MAGMDREAAGHLLRQLRELRETVEHGASERETHWEVEVTRPVFRASRSNLAHYLALREQDLRPLQAQLPPFGLSSLGRSESRVMANLSAVIGALELMTGAPAEPHEEEGESGLGRLEANTVELFGPARDGRHARVMVTLSPKVGTEDQLVAALLDAGMDCARINCAHDSPGIWLKMIETLRRVGAAKGYSCPVCMDLAGPKIRTEEVIARKKMVEPGDSILITFDAPGKRSAFDFQASCGAPEVLGAIQAGTPCSIKDGRIAGRIDEVRDEGLVLRVERTPKGGEPLLEHKGINFPGTALDISPLTPADLKALDFIAEHADAVSYSFVQRQSDVALLQGELERRRDGRPPMPIIAKIETQLAFEHLPELIVQGASRNPFGIMIARGDLAVEIGFERLAEVQEEILWIAEAAHVPVIWATQVLESLVKNGMPSRGEYTDAAMGVRAECVMLNKGKHIQDGVMALDDLLRRMEQHQLKKTPQLRALKSWRYHGG